MDIDIIAEGLNSINPKINKEDSTSKKFFKAIVNLLIFLIIIGLLAISIWMGIENFH